MTPILSGTNPSPLRNAIAAASAVICVALAVYAAAAAADDWPALVMASFGAALGAGFTINALAARDLDGTGDADPSAPNARAAAIAHQLLCAGIPALIGVAGWSEDARWLIGAVALGPAWAWTLVLMVELIEQGGVSVGDSYARAYQIAALAIALWLIYDAVATDTPWLWRPTKWDDFQVPLWLIVLEFASAPITIAAMKSKR